MASPLPTDPMSPLQTEAVGLREYYESLVLAGFTDDQAMDLIKNTLNTAAWIAYQREINS